MPVTPAITLTATLDDLFGAVDAKGYIQIILCNFGSVLPQIAGTSMIAKFKILKRLTAGTFSSLIWGNDQISPDGTFYCISILDENQNTVQSANYQLTGTGDQDLSSLTPYDPPPPPAPPASALYIPVPFSATPVFAAGINAVSTFGINLTGDVTSSTFIGRIPGQVVNFLITPNGHSFVWPSNVFGAPTISGSSTVLVVAVADATAANLYVLQASGGGGGSTNTVSTLAGTLTGALNGVNETFTIVGTMPAGPGTLLYNGFTQIYGVDYSVSGTTMTLNFAPISTDVLVYTYPV